jgi:outer membrane receptor protein involved in Fe transport
MTAQAAYEVNGHLQLTLEGRNLLDAEEKYTLGGNPLLSNGYFRYGRAFTLGVSLRY